MTTYIGAQPRTVGNILWERPRKPVHRCQALEAYRDGVAGEHREQWCDDYLAFAAWFRRWYEAMRAGQAQPPWPESQPVLRTAGARVGPDGLVIRDGAWLAEQAGDIFDAVLADDLDHGGILTALNVCDECGHDSHHTPCEAALTLGDGPAVCNCPYPILEGIGDDDA